MTLSGKMLRNMKVKKADADRVKRIIRKSIRIIEANINEMYDEHFEPDTADDDDAG